MLGYDLEDVSGDQAEEVSGGELQGYLHRQRVNNLDRTVFVVRLSVAGPGPGLVRLDPTVNAESYVF